MLSCCQTSKQKLDKDPQKYLQSNLMLCLLEGNTIVCSLAEKKNNSGIMYNDRFLLLHGHRYLGYFNKLQQKVPLPYKSLLQIPKMKYQVPLKNFIQWSIKQKVFTLKYFQELKGKKENKEWVFKFETVDLAKEWKLHLKRAEQERKDAEKREADLRNNPQSIIRISEDLKQGRGIVGAYEKLMENDKEKIRLMRGETAEYQTNTVYEPIRVIEPDDDEIRRSEKVHKPIVSSFLREEDSHGQDRIIDMTTSHHKTKSPPSPLSPKSVSKKSAKSLKSLGSPKSQTKQSKFSPIDNIHARSPSLNSSIRQSPSLHRSNSHSPSHGISKSPQASSQLKDEKSKYLNVYSSKIRSQQSSIQNSKVVVPVEEPPQVSPRWKQPAVVVKERWNQRLQRENVPNTVYEFGEFSTKVARDVVDGLAIGSQELRLKRKRQYELMVEFEGFVVCLCFLGEKEGRERSTFAQVMREFTNFQYVFTCLENKLEPIPILTSITFYKGILVYLICPVSSPSPTTPTISPQLSQKITQKTRISTPFPPSHLTTDSSLNKLFLTTCLSYLPTLHSSQLPRNFLQLPDFESQKFQTTDLATTHNKNDRKSQYFKKVSDQHLKNVVGYLDSFDEYVVNSKEFEQFLERHGVSEQGLGELYDLSKNPYVKQILGFECVFRVAKQIYFKELQMTLTSTTDMSSNLIIDKNILLLNSNKTLIDITIGFLNSMVGRDRNAEVVWEIVNRELGERFNLYGVEVVFNNGYYLQGLVYHFNVDIDWKQIRGKKGFDPEFVHSSISEFKTQNKVYNCDFCSEFRGIEKLIRKKNEESYKILLQSLDLHKSPIPEYYKLSRLYYEIKVFLSVFVSPTEESQRFKHLGVYEELNQEPPTATSLELHVNYLKWTLKENKRQEALGIFDDISGIVNRWLGPHHPELIEVYNLLSSYYESLEEYDDAIALAKSSIVICLRAFGSNSLRLAECYSFLADVYSTMQRHDESLINQKKARSIYDANNETSSIGYILMLIRIARLELHFGKINFAKEDIQECLRYFERNEGREEHLVSAYEIAARCYEVTKDVKEYKGLVGKICGKLVVIGDPLLLQKCIKIVVIYPLKELKKEAKFVLKQIVERLPRAISEQAYIEGYQYIRSCFKEDRFDFYVENTFKNAKPLQSLDNMMATKGSYTENKKAVGLIQALRNFIGTGFITKFIN